MRILEVGNLNWMSDMTGRNGYPTGTPGIPGQVPFSDCPLLQKTRLLLMQ